VSGSGISCAVCKSEPRPRQITTPASHHMLGVKSNLLARTKQKKSSVYDRTDQQIVVALNVSNMDSRIDVNSLDKELPLWAIEWHWYWFHSHLATATQLSIKQILNDQ